MNKKILIFFWIIFVATHLINILQFPIFEDEAEYLLLAQQVFNNPIHDLFIYSLNGVLPMFGWLVSIFMIFIHDSLLAGRLLNVLLASTLVFWIDMIASLYKFNNIFGLCSSTFCSFFRKLCKVISFCSFVFVINFLIRAAN